MEYFPSLSLVAVRLSSTKRTAACATGLPPGSVTRPESVRASEAGTAAALRPSTRMPGSLSENAGRGEEAAQGAVRRVNPSAGARRVGFDVRGGVRTGAVELCVGPGSGARQRELQERREQPDRAHPAHAALTLRTTHASASSSPYMQTISGPVGRSALYDTHRPSSEASAPEPHEMYASRRMSRVNRNAMTAGTTRKLNTISTPATGTASVITTPNDR